MFKQFEITYPIIQAPMAGITTPQFVAASANAGVLGAIGAGYLSGEETRDFIREVKKRTAVPFMVNVFVPEKVEVEAEIIQKASDDLEPIRKVLGVHETEYQLKVPPFDDQIDVVIEEGVKICSFTFGCPEKEVIQRLKAQNIFLIGTATTKQEALLLEKAGMDAIVVQGAEAGGHRGSFDGKLTFIPLRELLREIIGAVQIPVIAAGGIANQSMANEMFALGAEAIQIGTALLATEESGANLLYKEAILQANEGGTIMTTAFTGKAARGIRNLFIEMMTKAEIAPYPIQNDLTKSIRREAARHGQVNFMSLWAGENAHLTREGKVQEVIARFID